MPPLLEDEESVLRKVREGVEKVLNGQRPEFIPETAHIISRNEDFSDYSTENIPVFLVSAINAFSFAETSLSKAIEYSQSYIEDMLLLRIASDEMRNIYERIGERRRDDKLLLREKIKSLKPLRIEYDERDSLRVTLEYFTYRCIELLWQCESEAKIMRIKDQVSTELPTTYVYNVTKEGKVDELSITRAQRQFCTRNLDKDLEIKRDDLLTIRNKPTKSLEEYANEVMKNREQTKKEVFSESESESSSEIRDVDDKTEGYGNIYRRS